MKASLSIIKERKKNERRVILTPNEVRQLVQRGHVVYAEHDCGILSNFTDEMYTCSGAIIVNQQDAWKYGDIKIKYKAPMSNEYTFFKEDTILAALFHAEGNYDLLKAMKISRITAYTFEFFETNDGFFPLAYPGGEIAGKSAIFYAAHYLQNQYGGKGKLLCDVTGVKPPRIGIIGYGSVGSSAISLAVSLGCEVVVFGQNLAKLRKLQISFSNKIEIVESTQQNFSEFLPTLDVLIGSILISTYDTPPLITRKMIHLMEPGSVIVDVTCGYGPGYMPFINGYTNFEQPYQIVDGIICIKIDMLPAAYHQTTTAAYAANLLPYVIRLLDYYSNLQVDEVIQSGCIISEGKIVHPEIKKHWDFYEKNKL